ncbi:MAG TPA: MFS transporter [Bacteroidales bacterium]|nr:MFS transporter [Bacteroidales bacterium]HOK73809.1 MFS transporter [Bacteroidales bacterium]HOM40065.1 MFS transporter [Bacteroidales bacterium]HPP91750.1 MFS transporter [Bacteroidales bacterium]HRT46767.1 MFS transporter [Bacteroidales bacterium]
MVKRKPPLSFWQIWNMSFGFLGIQFGFALQNANVSRIFETLGAKIEEIPILWIAAPVTGLIVQPIIGHMSDNTWNRLGRRRPYFLTGAILASLALLIMPNSPALWVAAGMLWVMDASINISMEPFRAFVGDMLPPEQRTKGFATQSFFIGTGAVIASLLPYILTNWLNVRNTAQPGEIPPSVKLAFYIGAAVFLSAILWTVIKTREYSPEELKEFSHVESKTPDEKPEESTVLNKEIYIRHGIYWTSGGILLSIMIMKLNLEAELYILTVGAAVFGLIQLISGLFISSGKTKSGLVIVITDLFKMPRTMKQLAVVQFFSWFALFSMWIYTTSAVTHHIYGTSDTSSELYNRGANWVGVMFAVYNGFAALMAFLLPVVARYTNRKFTHMISLIAGGVGLISIILFKKPELLIISMLGVGLAWASILAMPYAILTGSLPPEKMGTYMGIFNFFIVIPQIMAASILGFLVKHLFGGESIFAIVTGGVSMFLAAVSVLFVDDKD